jgi:hypothetical protein
MSHEFAFAVLLIVETKDPRLSEEALTEALGSNEAATFAKVRRAVLQHLPKDVQRLVAILPVERARLLMQLDEFVATQIAGEPMTHPAPPDYVPPTRE